MPVQVNDLFKHNAGGVETGTWYASFDGVGSIYSSTTINSDASGTENEFTCSAWFRPNTISGSRFVFGHGGKIALSVSGAELSLDLRSSGTTFYNSTLGTDAIDTADIWYHVLIAGSVSSSVLVAYLNGEELYLDESFSGSTYDANAIRFAIGASQTTSVPWSGDVGPLWIDDSFIDFRQASNRDLFVDSTTKRAVDLGQDGSTPLGGSTVPWAYFPMRNGTSYVFTRYNGDGTLYASTVGVSFFSVPWLEHA